MLGTSLAFFYELALFAIWSFRVIFEGAPQRFGPWTCLCSQKPAARMA
jgi:hypothetical protein